MIIIGHRGARGLAPENTIAGLKKALECKVDQIEFDVRVTSDMLPVLHHDAWISVLQEKEFRIADHNYAELKKHKPQLPTLEEALKAISGKVALYIEVKPDEKVMPIIDVLKKYKFDYALGSKSQKTLLELHKALPKVPKIVISSWSGIRATHRADQLKTKLIAMNQHALWFGFVAAMHRSGYQLYAYTLNNPAKAKRWAKHGLAGVVTDYPDRFMK